mgnify:CR=1 FL=1
MIIYSIAYIQKDGKGFGGYPWLLGDFSSCDQMKEYVNKLKEQGYKNVVPFCFKNDELELDSENVHIDEITWDFVYSHRIVI